MASTLTPSRPQSVAASREPFAALRKEMDDLLTNFWGAPSTNWMATTLSPAMDIAEGDNAFTVKVDIPGMEAKDLNVQVHGNTLTVSGQRQEAKETKDKTFYRMERRSGSFSRTATLPCNINEDEVVAEYVNGVLSLTLPKAESAKAKKISVKG
jgi:HSP20 family protein